MKKPFACKIGFHNWCQQSGFASFRFCNYCTKGWPESWLQAERERIEHQHRWTTDAAYRDAYRVAQAERRRRR